MKYILFLCLTVLLFSCRPSRSCGDWRNVERFNSRPFRAAIDTGQCVKVICMTRIIEGRLYYFMKEDSTVFHRNLRGKVLQIGEYYLM